MCGIGGFIHTGSNFDLNQISKYFKDGLIHRGPDNQGEWFSKEDHLLFSHTRLINFGSFRKCKPTHEVRGWKYCNCFQW